MTQHPPKLTGQFHGRRLAIGAGDGNGHFGEGRKIAGSKQGKQATGVVMGDMHRPLHLRLGPRHDGNSTSAHGVIDEILAIDPQPLEGAEDRARCNLPVIDREARHRSVQRRPGVELHIQPLDKRPEAHLNAFPCPALAGA